MLSKAIKNFCQNYLPLVFCRFHPGMRRSYSVRRDNLKRKKKQELVMKWNWNFAWSRKSNWIQNEIHAIVYKNSTKMQIIHNNKYTILLPVPIEVRNDSLHISIMASWSSWSALLLTVLAGAKADDGASPDAAAAIATCLSTPAAKQHCVQQPKYRRTVIATNNFTEDIILNSLFENGTNHKMSTFNHFLIQCSVHSCESTIGNSS